jgi:hypothetical protein
VPCDGKGKAIGHLVCGTKDTPEANTHTQAQCHLLCVLYTPELCTDGSVKQVNVNPRIAKCRKFPSFWKMLYVETCDSYWYSVST